MGAVRTRKSPCRRRGRPGRRRRRRGFFPGRWLGPPPRRLGWRQRSGRPCPRGLRAPLARFPGQRPWSSERPPRRPRPAPRGRGGPRTPPRRRRPDEPGARAPASRPGHEGQGFRPTPEVLRWMAPSCTSWRRRWSHARTQCTLRHGKALTQGPGRYLARVEIEGTLDMDQAPRIVRFRAPWPRRTSVQPPPPGQRWAAPAHGPLLGHSHGPWGHLTPIFLASTSTPGCPPSASWSISLARTRLRPVLGRWRGPRGSGPRRSPPRRATAFPRARRSGMTRLGAKAEGHEAPGLVPEPLALRNGVVAAKSAEGPEEGPRPLGAPQESGEPYSGPAPTPRRPGPRPRRSRRGRQRPRGGPGRGQRRHLAARLREFRQPPPRSHPSAGAARPSAGRAPCSGPNDQPSGRLARPTSYRARAFRRLSLLGASRPPPGR